MKVAVVLGTRPEIIKLSPLIEELAKTFDLEVIHTGQHYSPALDRNLFKELELPYPRLKLKGKRGNFAVQIGGQIMALAQAFEKIRPDYVLVQGDTNSAMTASLVAARMNIPILHIEAGCRSGNLHSPEEQNRLLIDSISSINFCSDNQALHNLKVEGKHHKSYLSGSLTFDALKRSSKLAKKAKSQFGYANESYVLATLHRAENLIDEKKFLEKISLLNWIAERTYVIFALHPRTRKYLSEKKIKLNKKIHLTGPLGHLEFITLLENCRLVLSDSGGIQEEAAYFDRPCLVLRNETEWMRLIKAGKNFLLSTIKDEEYQLVNKLLLDDRYYVSVRKKKSPECRPGAVSKIVGVLKKLEK